MKKTSVTILIIISVIGITWANVNANENVSLKVNAKVNTKDGIAVADFSTVNCDSGFGVLYSQLLITNILKNDLFLVKSREELKALIKGVSAEKIKKEDLINNGCSILITGQIKLISEFLGKEKLNEYTTRNIEKKSYLIDIEILNLKTNEKVKLKDQVPDTNGFQNSSLEMIQMWGKVYVKDKVETVAEVKNKKTLSVFIQPMIGAGLFSYRDFSNFNYGFSLGLKKELDTFVVYPEFTASSLQPDNEYYHSLQRFSLFFNAGYTLLKGDSFSITPAIGFGMVLHRLKETTITNNVTEKKQMIYYKPGIKAELLCTAAITEDISFLVSPDLNMLVGGNKNAYFWNLKIGIDYKI